jgi:hypothetical protein
MNPVLLVITFVIVAVFAVSSMSYNDESLEHQTYCSNVEEGVWPDYKGIFLSECR